MSFTTAPFWVFLVLVFIVYWFVRASHWQNILLLWASYVFYGWLDPWLAVLLGISTLVDFSLAKGMQRFATRKRIFMTIALILNLGVLAFFQIL